MFRRRNIIKNERGATAIEFAMVAPLFLAFVLGIVDVGAYFFVAGQLQHGVVQAARQIRTGDIIGNNGASRDQFRAALCDNIKAALISDCTSNVRVNVESFANYTSVTAPSIDDLDDDGNGTIEEGETKFDTGGASCPVVVRAYFNYSTIVPQLQKILAAAVPGTSYITAATTFRNEPFTGGTTTACQ